MYSEWKSMQYDLCGAYSESLSLRYIKNVVKHCILAIANSVFLEFNNCRIKSFKSVKTSFSSL